MAHSERYRVNGYLFTVSYATKFADGLIVDPAEADIKSKKWLAAFEYMQARYSVILAFMAADDQCDHAIYSYKDDADQTIYALKVLREVQARDDYELLPDGNKERLAALIDQCTNHLVTIATAKNAPVQKRKKENTDGHVYLLQSPTGAYKIGRAKNPEHRLKTFGVQLPFEVEYIAVIPTPDMYALELELHALYAAKRINGEWFALDAADVETIKALAVQA